MTHSQGQVGHASPAGLLRSEPPTAWPILILAMLLILVPVVTLSQLIAHLRLDVVDDQMFGYYGWRIAHGATVYADVWDNKPPGIYWLNALGFLIGRDSYTGVVALCVTALVVAHAGFFVAAASLYYRGAAAVATVLASFYITHGYYQGGTNRTETFLVAFELLALALYMRGWARERWWKWYLAGVFAGCAFTFKQVGLAAWGAMGLHLIILMATRELRFTQGLRRGLLLLSGAATTLALVCAVLASQNVLDDALFATFTFNRAYFSVGATSFSELYLAYFLLKEHLLIGLRLPILMAIAAGIHAFLWWLRPKFRPPEIEQPLRGFGPVCPRYMLLFAIWFAVAFYGAMLSPHEFRHYLVPAMPPLLLIGGYLINVLQAEMNLLLRLQHRAWVTAAFVAMGYFAYTSVDRQFQEAAIVWRDRDPQRVDGKWVVKLSEVEVLGDEVARLTTPDQKIHCWGYVPGLYLRARRINACRYTTTEKIGQVAQEADFIARELLDTVEKEPPAVMVISAGDLAKVRGEIPTAKVNWIDERLRRLLDEQYTSIAELHNDFIFRRNDLR